MISKQKLEEMENVDISQIDINNLQELTDIEINEDDTIENKAELFFSQIGNPFLFKINGVVVQIAFNNHQNSKKTLDDVLYSYFTKIKDDENIVI